MTCMSEWLARLVCAGRWRLRSAFASSHLVPADPSGCSLAWARRAAQLLVSRLARKAEGVMTGGRASCMLVRSASPETR